VNAVITTMQSDDGAPEVPSTGTPAEAAAAAGDGGAAAGASAGPAPELSLEQVQELLMISSFTASQLKVLWRKFVSFGADPLAQTLSAEQFLAIPSIAVNPLASRLLLCFAFDEESSLISFTDFVAGMAVFSHHGDKKQKLHFAFKMQDFNNDGKICKEDLLANLRTVSDFGAMTAAAGAGGGNGGDDDKDGAAVAAAAAAAAAAEAAVDERLRSVVARTMEEASSAADGESLSPDDFNKVVAPTDFASKLVIVL